MEKVQQGAVPALRQHKYDNKCTILILGLCLLQGAKNGDMTRHIQGEAHKVLQSNSTQTIDHIQKCFRTSFSIQEGCHTRPRYFFIGGGT